MNMRVRKTVPFVTMLLIMSLVVPASAAVSVNGLPELSALAKTAGQSVVNISTTKHAKAAESFDSFRGMPKNRDPQGSPFEDFFDQFEKYFGKRMPRTPKQRSLGSGFIISKDGYIVTNNHVVAEADEIEVQLQDVEKPFKAKIVGRDPETDLALVKIDPKKDLPVLEFGDSDKAEVGDWVIAIGNPFGLDHTVTTGIISAKGRVIGAGAYDDFLQTDASINPGNSGGPLLTLDGKVVGINTAIIASGQGIGFAVPSSMAKKVINELREHKKVQRGWLGVSIQDLDENTAKALGLDEAQGALVANVNNGDPADKAGVETSDVILEVNDDAVEDAGALTRKIATLSPGEKAKLTVWRKGKKLSLTAVLGERDMKKIAADGQMQSEDAGTTVLGLELRSVNDREAKAMGLEKGKGLLVLDIDPDSAAAEAGIRAGDVILEINQQPVGTPGEFKNIVQSDAKEKGVAMLLIRRQGNNFFKTLDLK